MIKFSTKTQSFYAEELEYMVLPNDLVEITNEEHAYLLGMLSSGCIILSNLTCTPPRPSLHHTWDGEGWIDPRTPEEVDEHNRAQMPNLTKRDFRKKLRDAKIFEQAEAYVRSSGDGYLEDAWDYSDYFVRLDPFIVQITEALCLTPEQVDKIWTQP